MSDGNVYIIYAAEFAAFLLWVCFLFINWECLKHNTEAFRQICVIDA